MNQKELAAELLTRCQQHDPDWYTALFSAALDETHDAEEALRQADAAIAEQPHAPEEEEPEPLLEV